MNAMISPLPPLSLSSTAALSPSKAGGALAPIPELQVFTTLPNRGVSLRHPSIRLSLTNPNAASMVVTWAPLKAPLHCLQFRSVSGEPVVMPDPPQAHPLRGWVLLKPDQPYVVNLQVGDWMAFPFPPGAFEVRLSLPLTCEVAGAAGGHGTWSGTLHSRWASFTINH